MESEEPKTQPQDQVSSSEFPVATALPEERSSPTYILIGVVTIIALVAVVIVATRPRSAPVAPAAALSADQKAYLDKVAVSGARMSAAENFLGHRVTILDAQVTNQGEREVREIELQLEFVDTLNQVVLRERAHPLAPHVIPLKPRETRAFQVSFDHMPLEWNQAPPRVAVVSLQF
jgi:hypothetical protein